MNVTAPHISPLDRLHEDFRWTPRQRQVLGLLAAGHTNGEIATALGISLDGAKWHVSEVMTKLGTNSRDEAAEYWRAYNRMPLRFSRAMRGFIAGLAVRPVAVGAGIIALVGVAAFGVLLLGTLDDDDKEPAASDETPEPTLATAAPDQTVSPDATASSTALQTPVPQDFVITGLFSGPRPQPPATTVEVSVPESPFPEWNGNAVVYNLESEEVVDLGPGTVPVFSPDNERALFLAGENALVTGTLTLLDLSTGATQHLGISTDLALWLSAERILFRVTANDWEAINLATGAREPAGPPTDALFRSGFAIRDLGYSLTAGEGIGAQLQRGGNSLRRYAVEFPDRILEFEAFWVVPQSEERIVVATEPDLATLETNLFSVDLTTGEATFLITTLASSPNWPLSAFRDKVMWTERYCALIDDQTNLLEPAGDLMVLDTESGELVRVLMPEFARMPSEGIYATLISSDEFAVGTFGTQAVGTLEPLTLSFVLPVEARSLSNDLSFAGMGQFLGHGGLC